MPVVWINGNFIDEDEASISLRDTGLLHAAGVFTTMLAIDRRVFRLPEHLRRLRDSCEALFIPLLPRDDVLTGAIDELLQRNGLTDARLRLTVTRGRAIDDPVHGLRLEPSVFCTAGPFEPYPAEFYQRGMTVILLDEFKLNPFDIQAGHKTLNYFSRLAALRDANRRGAGEALWFNVHFNSLQSGSISNVFIVKDGRLITPPTPVEMRDPKLRERIPYPKSAVLPGIMRGAVLDIAGELGISANLGAIDIGALLDADEVFLTNSVMRVMPVCRIERKAIGNDKPGPITRRIAQRIDELVGITSS